MRQINVCIWDVGYRERIKEIRYSLCSNWLSLVHLTDKWCSFLWLHTISMLKENERKKLIGTQSIVYQKASAKKGRGNWKITPSYFLSYLHASYLCATERHDRAYWCLCEYINSLLDIFAYTTLPSVCTKALKGNTFCL